MGQAVEDAQTFARNMVVSSGGQRLPGNPIKMSTNPDPVERPRHPDVGAHGDAIRDELGL
jgi:CoA:oxalate CoA-transferase